MEGDREGKGGGGGGGGGERGGNCGASNSKLYVPSIMAHDTYLQEHSP